MTYHKTIFNKVPSEAKKGSQDSSNQLNNGMKTYAKICNFEIALLVNHDKIKNDVLYINNSSSKVAITIQKTLTFYDFRDRYNYFMLKSAPPTPELFEQKRTLTIRANAFSTDFCSTSI